MSPPIKLLWDTGTVLGEGPVWCPDEQALWFVDIKGGALHRFAPGNGQRNSYPVGGMPSFIVPSQGSAMLVGSGDGIFAANDGAIGERIVTIDMPSGNRTNDATVDADGRLWFGTMDNGETKETGALYCLDRDALHIMPAKGIVTNGPAITTDCQTLYFVDSVNRRIWRHALGDGPEIASPDLFLQLSPADGHPDGIVLDSEECLWVALWDGWGVRRYAPDGTMLLHVGLPCARVTKIALGGPDLCTAYVTTAQTGLDAGQLAQQPAAGGLFAFEAPAPGRPLPRYRPAA